MAIQTRRGSFAAELEQLIEEGFRAGRPPANRLLGEPYGGEIEETVCREATCDGCGATGLSYRSFLPPYGRPLHERRAYAVCPKCSAWEEV